MPTRETVIAAYRGFDAANRAFQSLLDEGFFRSDVGLAAVDYPHDYWALNARFEHPNDGLTKGLGHSALLATGTFALTPMTVAGIGTVIAAGSLSSLLGNNDGLLKGGMAAALARYGVPAEKAQMYVQALRYGYALVTAHLRTPQAIASAIHLLKRSQPVDAEQAMLGQGETPPPVAGGYSAPEGIGRFPHHAFWAYTI